MNILFDNLADFELSDAIDFYELQQKGLGNRFKQEIKSAVLRIKKFPTLSPIIKRDIRRYQLHKFPYKILYSMEENYIYIIAISHNHRRPDYWVERH